MFKGNQATSSWILSKLQAWRTSPLQFVTDCIEATPSDQQAEALYLFPKTKRLTIRSGHGTGKDACASWLILNFLCTRPYSKVVCTAPTNRQLADILWSEISKWLRKSRLSDEFVIQKDKIFHKDAPKEWWARAVSASVKATKEEQAETLAGFHGDHLLIVVDEASGVPDPVYIPLEGALTQEDNRVLLIGNMTRNQGYFYESHFHPKHSLAWTTLHWDSRNSTNVADSYPEYMATKYGEESNIFRIRVMGDPPMDSENTLIPLAWALQCIDNEMPIAEDEPVYLGVDVARYGEDKSIILPRKGNRIYPWDSFQGMNTIDLGARVMANFTDMEASGVACDEIGVGAGVTDWLQKRPGGYETVFGINTATRSSDRNKYIILRDELWAGMREKCMRQQYWFPGSTEKERDMSNELCNELACLTYELQGSAIKVESKKIAKMRGVASPNIADALALTEYFNNVAYLIWSNTARHKAKRDKWKKDAGDVSSLGNSSWQVR
jgi:phage terminase large subunit